jgi:hypothetical protein
MLSSLPGGHSLVFGLDIETCDIGGRRCPVCRIFDTAILALNLLFVEIVHAGFQVPADGVWRLHLLAPVGEDRSVGA